MDRRKRIAMTPLLVPKLSASAGGRPASPPGRIALGTPRGISSNAAILSVGAWLSARGLCPPIGRSWSIELGLDAAVGPASLATPDGVGSKFHVRLSSGEWGFTFCHAGRISTIRVGDVPCVLDRDDHHLLAATPPLAAIPAFIRQLEQRHGICFQRRSATVRTTIAGAEPVVLAWLSAA